MTRPVALATCAEVPVESNEAPLEAALAAAGVAYEWAVWDDPAVDWSRFAAVLIRTTWDYIAKVGAFLAWADAVGAATTLWNPASAVRWNRHKGYLVELADREVDVVPTTVVRVGEAPEIDAIRSGWSAGVVVKPAESAGSIGLSAWVDGDVRRDATAAVAALHRRGHDAVVQPLVDGIRHGETSLVVIDSQVSHAVLKVPVEGDIRSQPEWGAGVGRAPVTPAHEVLVHSALAAAAAAAGMEPDHLLYARVDCVEHDGRPHLMELELIEPDLYLGHDEHTAARLVAALQRRSTG